MRRLRHELAFWRQRSRELAGHLLQANRDLVQVLPTAKVQAPIRVTKPDAASGPARRVIGHIEKCHFYINQNGDSRLFVSGWTWSKNSRIVAIDLFVNSRRVAGMVHNTRRADIQKAHKGPPEMAWCGFGKSMLLSPDFSIDAQCYLQVCDADGHLLRFELDPVMDKSSGISSPQPSRTRTAIARVGTALRSVRAGWLRKKLKWSVRRKARARFRDAPFRLSLLLLIDDQEYSSLSRCVESVQRQLCGCWELLVLSQSESGQALAERLVRSHGRDGRIRMLPFRSASHMGALNEALERATGRYVCFLTGRELLADDALAWVALTAEARPQAAWLYCDGQIVDQAGQLARSDFKPDFSDVHLWATFFTKGFSVYDKSEVLHVGGLREQADGAGEYDLTLRLARELLAPRIVHIPHPLFLALDAETGDSPEHLRRRYASEAEAANCAIRDAGVSGTAQSRESARAVRRIELNPRSNIKVAIVIPTRDQAALLRRCLASLRAATEYPNYRVIVIDNQSTEPDLLDLLKENVRRDDFEVVRDERPFNHSLMHNEVLADVDAEFAVLLNNDVMDFSAGWLEQMVAACQISRQVASVGTLLLYPDGRVQHGGVILDAELVARHAHVDVPREAAGYGGRLHCLQDLSACTAACLLVRLSAFRHVGGFDTEGFPTLFNDVDLCLRLRHAGYRCLYQPAVQATHYESASRRAKSGNEIPGLEGLRQRLQADTPCDPFHNPNLTADLQPIDDGLTTAETECRRLQRLSNQLDEASAIPVAESSDSASLCVARENGVF